MFRDDKNPSLSVNLRDQYLCYFLCEASVDKNFIILSLAIWQINIVFWVFSRVYINKNMGRGKYI